MHNLQYSKCTDLTCHPGYDINMGKVDAPTETEIKLFACYVIP